LIIVKEEVKNKIRSWNDSTIHVLTDFDRTLTLGTTDSLWKMISKSNMVPKEYIEARNTLFNYYRPYEIDETLDLEKRSKLMSEWWRKHVNLLIKYKLSESAVKDVINNSGMMRFRDDAKEFLQGMKKRNIPVIIISAGIGNFIKQFLVMNECYYDNVYIVSNFIEFKDGLATGISGNVIHSMNKNEASLPEPIKKVISERPNIILLGDVVSDVLMAKEKERRNALKIGFLNDSMKENVGVFKDNFDVICTKETNYYDLFNSISLLNR